MVAQESLFERGLLYRGHKIVWWWAQGGTALSSGEVGQGYREVADPSVYVRFPLESDPESVARRLDNNSRGRLPSNPFRRRATRISTYAYCLDEETESSERIIVAEGLVDVPGRENQTSAQDRQDRSRFDCWSGKALSPAVRLLLCQVRLPKPAERFAKRRFGAQRHCRGESSPPISSRIDSGTGAVHIAPAFGEVDFDVLNPRKSSRFEAGQGPQRLFVPLIPKVNSRTKPRITQAHGSRMLTNRSHVGCATTVHFGIKSSTCTIIRSAGGPNQIR